MRDGWQAPLAALVVVILFAAFKAKPIATAADIAAWVQGVGSLLAIIAAVWIYAKQYQDKKAEEVAETRAFVLAIRTEMGALWEGYSLGVRPHFDKLPQNDGLRIHAPLHAEALIIYTNSPGRVGKIDDERLRDLVVVVYARMRGMIYSLQLNSVMLKELLEAETLMMDMGKGPLGVVQKRGEFVRYGQDLKRYDSELGKLMQEFFTLSDAWLRRHPIQP